jgi:hypothetical protein
MLSDHVLVGGEVDAKGLVVGNVGFDPLDLGGKLGQSLVRLGGGAAQLLALQGPDLGNVALDHVFVHGASLVLMR